MTIHISISTDTDDIYYTPTITPLHHSRLYTNHNNNVTYKCYGSNHIQPCHCICYTQSDELDTCQCGHKQYCHDIIQYNNNHHYNHHSNTVYETSNEPVQNNDTTSTNTDNLFQSSSLNTPAYCSPLHSVIHTINESIQLQWWNNIINHNHNTDNSKNNPTKVPVTTDNCNSTDIIDMTIDSSIDKCSVDTLSHNSTSTSNTVINDIDYTLHGMPNPLDFVLHHINNTSSTITTLLPAPHILANMLIQNNPFMNTDILNKHNPSTAISFNNTISTSTTRNISNTTLPHNNNVTINNDTASNDTFFTITTLSNSSTTKRSISDIYTHYQSDGTLTHDRIQSIISTICSCSKGHIDQLDTKLQFIFDYCMIWHESCGINIYDMSIKKSELTYIFDTQYNHINATPDTGIDNNNTARRNHSPNQYIRCNERTWGIIIPLLYDYLHIDIHHQYKSDARTKFYGIMLYEQYIYLLPPCNNQLKLHINYMKLQKKQLYQQYKLQQPRKYKKHKLCKNQQKLINNYSNTLHTQCNQNDNSNNNKNHIHTESMDQSTHHNVDSDITPMSSSLVPSHSDSNIHNNIDDSNHLFHSFEPLYRDVLIELQQHQPILFADEEEFNNHTNNTQNNHSYDNTQYDLYPDHHTMSSNNNTAQLSLLPNTPTTSRIISQIFD